VRRGYAESTTIAESVGFEVRDIESLRDHSMLTLRHWVSRLEAHREAAIQATNETTYRVCRLFMSAAAHQFETGETNVYQSLLAKPEGGREFKFLLKGAKFLGKPRGGGRSSLD
jgi:cyclopropane-fatty-acyl-phospholipid synthase